MDSENITIRPTQIDEYGFTENLTREAFWNVYRPGCLEHYLLRCIRSCGDYMPELDLVLERNGTIIGHIIYVRAEIEIDSGDKLPIMTFGPISIDPQYKRQGYGTMLLRQSMEIARRLGTGALAITGNIDFYGNSSFFVGKSSGIRYRDDPDADYFLVAELKKGFLDGVSGAFSEPPCYNVDPADAEEYDKSFPPKQKLKLPGQLV